ncbi:MAG: hypothetical protein JSU94_20795 [Phycisphaerales bacterium]|nr:MAG: hypothetical protein JSU94_20795 [Phycisphaerales bacterium]
MERVKRAVTVIVVLGVLVTAATTLGMQEAREKSGGPAAVDEMSEAVTPAPTGGAVSGNVRRTGQPMYDERRRGRAYGYDRAEGPRQFRGPAVRKPLVIPTADIDAEQVARIGEDMQVMSHILAKSAGAAMAQAEQFFAEFGDLLTSDRGSPQAIYLQGYGALFIIETDILLSPPEGMEAPDVAPPEEEVDKTWQQARDELFSPEHTRRRSHLPEEYDSRRVKALKGEIVKSLKHAANIRQLQQNEWVVVTVTNGRRSGGDGGGYGFFEYYSTNTGRGTAYGSRGGGAAAFPGGAVGFGGGGGFGGGAGQGATLGGPGAARATVMTIRAKKPDVDEFAKGKVDSETFRQNVQIFTY